MNSILSQIRSFGDTANGEEVAAITLHGAGGLKAEIISYGAALRELHVPDCSGEIDDVVLGFDSIEAYESPQNPYFGATIGRYANRIAQGRFRLNGEDYQLACNAPPNHLHGGHSGALSKKNWSIKSLESNAVTLEVFSPDGEEGYPGNLRVRVSYKLTEDNELEISYEAECDCDTILNLTNHTYWNLSGGSDSTVGNHSVKLESSEVASWNKDCIPSKLLSVTDTALDFRSGRTLEPVLREWRDNRLTQGLDHSFFLGRESDLKFATTCLHRKSGRRMDIYTNEFSVHLYSGGCLEGIKGKGGVSYYKWGGICFECQNLPDAPNKPHFPSAVLRGGEVYQSRTIHRFSTVG